ncbi:MAG: hypothetical protein IKK26_04485 [Clostridia bacterium]|nr:hypothetical protein [Clostridia bacterium]
MTAYAWKESTARELNTELDSQEIKSIRGRKSEKAKVPYIKYAIIAVCFFASLIAIIFLNMQSAELAAENSRLKTQMSELVDEEKSLNAKREQMYNLEYVEDYAVNVLGMVKLDKTNISYVELSNEERVRIAEPEQNDSAVLSGISRTFNILLEYLN